VNDDRERLLEPAGRAARGRRVATLAEMADATLALYDSTLAGPSPVLQATPFEPARVRDALGYRPWWPPGATRRADDPQGAHDTPPTPWQTRVARRALAMRHTTLGKAMHRLAPRPLLDALKARLHA